MERNKFRERSSSSDFEIKNIKNKTKLKCGEIYFENELICFQCLFCGALFNQNELRFNEHFEIHRELIQSLILDLKLDVDPVAQIIESCCDPDPLEQLNNIYGANRTQNAKTDQKRKIKIENEICENDSIEVSEITFSEDQLLEKQDLINSDLDFDITNSNEKSIIISEMIHQNDDSRFQCLFLNCSKTFKHRSSIYSHIRKSHSANESERNNPKLGELKNKFKNPKVNENDNSKEISLIKVEIESLEEFKKNSSVIATVIANETNSGANYEIINLNNDSHQKQISKVMSENEDGTFKCLYANCSKSFSRQESIYPHIWGNHSGILYKCMQCGTMFKSKVSVRKHQRLYPTGVADKSKRGCVGLNPTERDFIGDAIKFNNGLYYCPISTCTISSQEKELIRVHINGSVHSGKIFECTDCSSFYKFKNQLSYHINHFHQKNKEENSEENNGIHPCGYCGRIFFNLYDKNLHKKSCNEGKRCCEICGKSIISHGLKRHILTHSEEKSYQCNYCPKRFKLEMTLKVHVKGHLGQYNYQCRFCEKRFLIGSNRSRHEKNMHLNEKQFSCGQCDKRFVTGQKLKEHVKRHTNERPFSCSTCNKAFYDKPSLSNHVIAHSSDKPFECTICKTKFPRKKSLVTHMQIHSDVKKYKCQHCPKKFAQSAGLYSHMKQHGNH